MQKKLNNINFIPLLYFFLNCLLYISCNSEENPYNPCLKHFQTEAFIPATKSLDWIPYNVNQELLFANKSGIKIKLIRIINNEISESLKSHFSIKCPNDNLQTSAVDYTTFEYQNTFLVTEGLTSLISIKLNIDVLLDEKNSNLDDPKLADILKIEFKLKNSILDSTTLRLLQFPILDRGFTYALLGGYLYHSKILLDNKDYSEVYVNYENGDGIRAYYSMNGLIAFELQGDLYVRIN